MLYEVITYILIIVGAFIALYAQNQEEQNEFLLIGGIAVLMIGIYRISRRIPSKNDIENESKDDQES